MNKPAAETSVQSAANPKSDKVREATAFGKQLVRQYKIGFLHMQRFSEDFSDEEAREVPEGQMPLGWYLAHLMCTHDHFLNAFLGAEDPLDETFVGNYAAVRDDIDLSEIPPLSELMPRFERMWERGAEFMRTLEPEDLLRKPNIEAHPSFATLAGALTVLGFHDSYHAGQVAALRLAMDKPDLSEDIDLTQFT